MKKNLPAGAGDRGSIPRVAKQLGLPAAATEACAPGARVCNKRSADGGGKPVRTSKSRPFSPQLEKACARQRRPSAPKNVKKKEKKEISSFQKLNKSPRSADRNAELGRPRRACAFHTFQLFKSQRDEAG